MANPLLGSQTPRIAATRPKANPFTPPIPAPTTDVNNLQACVAALKAAVESLAGQRGDASNRAVTFRDLVSYNLLGSTAITSPSGGPDYGSGTTVVAADPSAIAGDVAVPGAAVTFMRSDAAPAVRKATSTLFGLVKPDGTSITVAGGVISAAPSAKYIIACSTAGAPTAAQAMLYHRFPAAASFAANFGPIPGHASQAGGMVNATAATLINVDKAAAATPNTFTTIGTITFAAGTVTPTFATTGGVAVTFAQGDVLRIVAPATPDATFAGFYCSLVGVEI